MMVMGSCMAEYHLIIELFHPSLGRNDQIEVRIAPMLGGMTL